MESVRRVLRESGLVLGWKYSRPASLRQNKVKRAHLGSLGCVIQGPGTVWLLRSTSRSVYARLVHLYEIPEILDVTASSDVSELPLARSPGQHPDPGPPFLHPMTALAPKGRCNKRSSRPSRCVPTKRALFAMRMSVS